MSIQFGRWISDGGPVDPAYLDRVRGTLAPYAPDGRQEYSAPAIFISYFPFHTTPASRCEIQPYVSPSGAVITWNGRLDNREELLRELNQPPFSNAADVSIVASAWDCFGAKTFGRLIGDWSLSIWDPHAQTLLLAKDFLGNRHLYYSVDRRGVTWCSVLDPSSSPVSNPGRFRRSISRACSRSSRPLTLHLMSVSTQCRLRLSCF